MARQTYLKLLLILAAAFLIFPSVLATTFSPSDVTFHTGASKTVNLTAYLSLDAGEALVGYLAPSAEHILITTPTNGNVTFSVQSAYPDWTGYEQVTLTAITNVTNYSKTIGVLVTDVTDDGKLKFSDGPDWEDKTGDDSQLTPGDTIETTFEVENAFSTSTDMSINSVSIKAWLQDSSGKRVTDRMETDSFDLSAGDTQDDSLTLIVPVDTTKSSLYLYVSAEGNDDDDVTHSVLKVIPLKIEKSDHDIAFDTITISPDPAVCGQALDIIADIWNVGTKEEDTKLHISSSALNIDAYTDLFKLDNSGNDREAIKTISVLLSSIVKPGNYTLSVGASYNGGKDSESVLKSIAVVCSNYVAGEEDNAGAAGNGALTFASSTIEGKQGTQSKISATLKNTGATAAVYTFELSGMQDWASGFVEPDTVTLAGGASTDIFVYVTPKTSATGDNTATVTAKSGGAVIESKTITMELPEKPSLSITSLGVSGIDNTSALLIIVGIIVVIGLLVLGKKRAAAAAVETYGNKRRAR